MTKAGRLRNVNPVLLKKYNGNLLSNYKERDGIGTSVCFL